jgi:purine-nucleoside phosphorylase
VGGVAERDPVARAAAWLRRRLPSIPRVGVILGSGMGDLDLGRPAVEIPYARIPGFPAARVAGHPGRLSLIGPCAILRGRVHHYEGRSMDEVTRPVRILARLGVKSLLLTNAAGGIHRAFRPGDLMVIADHLNLMGANPLRGGPHFLDLTSVYETRLPSLRGLRRGVYAGVAGPTYETPAEVEMLRKLGADAVGMSTVPEAIAARHEGLRVVALSLITNAAAGTTRKAVSHAEVLETAARARVAMGARLLRILRDLVREPGLPARP